MVLGARDAPAPRVTYCALSGNAPRAWECSTAGAHRVNCRPRARASYARPHSATEWRPWSDSGGGDVAAPHTTFPLARPQPLPGRPLYSAASRYLHHHSHGPTGVTKRDIKKSEDVVSESRNAGLETWETITRGSEGPRRRPA